MGKNDHCSPDTDRKISGEKRGKCCYESCENEATTLVKFEETKPKLHVWFCAPHAGNSIKKHDDAHTVQPGGERDE